MGGTIGPAGAVGRTSPVAGDLLTFPPLVFAGLDFAAGALFVLFTGAFAGFGSPLISFFFFLPPEPWDVLESFMIA
jgi:hypothetical protein